MKRAAGIVIALSLAACSHDRDVLYEDGPPTPYEAALSIYGHDSACVACVEESCGEVAQACADDDACADDALCRERCIGNPSCEHWDCKDPQPKIGRPTSPLEDCVIEHCADPCRVGHEFSCAGKYGVRLPEPGTVAEITFAHGRVPSGEPLPEGIRGRVCAGFDLECASPVDEAWSDAAGMITLAVPAPGEESGDLSPFQGYFEFTDPANDPPRIVPLLHPMTLVMPRSNSPGWPWTFAYFTADDIALFNTLLGIEVDPAAASVFTFIYDCRASERVKAEGLSVAVTPEAENTKYFYGPNPTATTTSGDGDAQASPVPPGLVTLTASFEGTEITRAVVTARAGAITLVALMPTSAAQ